MGKDVLNDRALNLAREELAGNLGVSATREDVACLDRMYPEMTVNRIFVEQAVAAA